MKLTKKKVKEMLQQDYKILYNPMPAEIKELFPVITVDVCSKYFGLHFTTAHQGKMQGMVSESTTCKVCRPCLAKIEKAYQLVMGPDFKLETATAADIKTARAKLKKHLEKNPHAENISICGFCFSDKQQDYMTSMTSPLARNHEILNNGVVHPDWLPILNTLYFRLESFGDYSSVNAVINSVNLMVKNPRTFFAAWTKNPGFFHKYFNGDASKKPGNCNIILSGPHINKLIEIPEKYRYFIDKVFTVFTDEYAAANDITINCGARSCLTCLGCYEKNNIIHMNERVK